MVRKKKGRQLLSIGLRSSRSSQAEEDLIDTTFLEDDEDIMGSTGPKGERKKKLMEEIIRSADFLSKSHQSSPNPQHEGIQAQQLSNGDGVSSSSRASWADEVDLEKSSSVLGSDPDISKLISSPNTVPLTDKGKSVGNRDVELEAGNSVNDSLSKDAFNASLPKESENSILKSRETEKSLDDGMHKERRNTEPRKSFVSLFADNRKLSNGLSLKFMPSSVPNSTSFTVDEWKEGEDLWSNALIGHVIGLNVKFKSMESYISKLWSNFSIPKVSLIKQGLFLFDFQSEKHMKDIFEAGPWFFGSRPLVLKPWSIDTDLDKIQDFSYPLWVQFPNLKLNLWSSTGISKVASLIGKPIATDKLTATRQRLSYARVLLEVNLPLNEPLPDHLVIHDPDGRRHVQEVIYEFKPRWCTLCSKVGHETGQCRRNARKIWVPVNRHNAQVPDANKVQHADVETNSEQVQSNNAQDKLAKDVLADISVVNVPGTGEAHVFQSSPTVNVTGFTSVAKTARKIQPNVPETKVADEKMKIIATKIAKDWQWTSNVQHTANKARIWVLWDSNYISVQNINSSEQFISFKVESKDGKLACFFTVVYALNQMEGRRDLWQDLLAFKRTVSGPWLVGGDFNAILNGEEKMGGAQVSDAEIEDFQNFIVSNHLKHIKSTGCFFTWSNKQDAHTRIWCRLDRMLVNEDWIFQYTSSQTEYLMPLCSDHSPGLITISDEQNEGKRPFKFFAMWAKHPDFSDEQNEGKRPFKFFAMWAKHPDFMSTVRAVWEQQVQGYNMYRFYIKLKKLKLVLRDLNKRHFMNISEQKTNISWGLHGDKSTQHFHSVMKNKRHHNKVLSLISQNGTRISDQQSIISEFVEYYKNLLGSSGLTTAPNPEVIIQGPILSPIHRIELSKPVTRDEIRHAVLTMPDGKAPGPDGFSASFFKSAWNVIKEDLFMAIEEFFVSGYKKSWVI
ncbi:uncharacterized protein LOC109832461 [Asparagus officinalis]|uniref:uncharacterized protein LOC109832461 n=1 Tax=Asparagus officinalis TaxID=4686 RepID=UPI00098E6AEE|nr:uncharacterized protein LOC109832461 [Asparagus officinalis]